MSKLTKRINISYTPGSPGVPSQPGTPAIPGYWSTVYTTFGPFDASVYWDEATNSYVFVPPTVQTRAVVSQVWVAPVAGVAPTPGTPATASQTISDYRIGWNAGARSAASFTGDCTYSLAVAASAIGVVSGLNGLNEGASYKEIEHALYFSRGLVLVYENGIAKTAGFAFTSADVFKVKRTGALVTYLQNDVLIYTSALASSGAVFVDSSLYMGGDTILSASFAAQSLCSASGSLQEIAALAASRSYTGARGSLLPFGGRSERFGTAAVNASLSPLRGMAATRSYASANAQLSALQGSAGQGELTPAYTVSAGSFAYLLGAARSLTGHVGSVSASLQALGGASADHPYTSARGSLQPLTGASLRLPVVTSFARLKMPSPRLLASGHDSTGENSFIYTLPAPTLRAFGGASARLACPTPVLSASGTGTISGRADLACPAPTLSASGVVTVTGQADLTLRDAFKAVGYSGAVCSITIGSATLQASGSTGAIGRAFLTLPLFQLVATGTIQNYGRADLLAPSARLGANAQAWLTAPSARLTAIGTAVVAVAYEAYSINLSHRGEAPDEVTRYSNFPFTQIVRYQNSYFGVAADGLYLLEGTTDDGALIAYAIRTCVDDLKTPEKKTAASVYLAGRIGPALTVTLHAGETGQESYAYSTPRGQGAQNHREKFGRGVKNRYFALSLAGTDALELDSLELEINKLNRRI